MSETIRPNLLFHWYRYSHPNDRQLSPPRGPPAVAPRTNGTIPRSSQQRTAPSRQAASHVVPSSAHHSRLTCHIALRAGPCTSPPAPATWTCDRSTDFIDAMSVKQELRTATTLTIIVLYRDRASTPAAMRDPIRDPPRGGCRGVGPRVSAVSRRAHRIAPLGAYIFRYTYTIAILVMARSPCRVLLLWRGLHGARWRLVGGWRRRASERLARASARLRERRRALRGGYRVGPPLGRTRTCTRCTLHIHIYMHGTRAFTPQTLS